MNSHVRVAVVTGANKGVGIAIVRQLALQHSNSPLRAGPLLIYLTARSPERGVQAVETIRSDAQLIQARALADAGGHATVTYHALDITSSQSVQDFADFLKAQHPDGIDILINNAGVALTGFDANVVRNTLATNYYGTLETSRSILPLLRSEGRLVNVSSRAGMLDGYSEEMREAFRAAARTSVSAVTSLMQRFQHTVDEGKQAEAGFPSSAYSVSKAGETAYTKALAMDWASKKPDILINACCPGYVNTDMTKGRGHKTPDEGAETPVFLALHDIGGKTGEFWRDNKVVAW